MEPRPVSPTRGVLNGALHDRAIYHGLTGSSRRFNGTESPDGGGN